MATTSRGPTKPWFRDGSVGPLGLIACVALLYAVTVWELSHLRF
jgi:hypothetical protein